MSGKQILKYASNCFILVIPTVLFLVCIAIFDGLIFPHNFFKILS